MDNKFEERLSKIKIHYVITLLKDEKVDPEYCSPNFINDFANNKGITLTSEEVVKISNSYE